jgi:polar amino acid transport system substrate-binding protein
VRGYDYGPIYQSIVEDMKALGRLAVETDPISAGRLMQNNANYVTIMAPTLFSGVVQTEEILKSLRGRLRFEKLEDLPWNESGIYVSKMSLNPSDQLYLKTQFEKYASTDAVWKAYLSYYPPEVVRLGLRQRQPANH